MESSLLLGSEDCDDCISISSFFSEESDFHGDETTKLQYEAQVLAFDPIDFWDARKWHAPQAAPRTRMISKPSSQHLRIEERDIDQDKQVIQARPNATNADRSQDQAHHAIAKPQNLLTGDTKAKRLDESLEDFLTRLPPSATTDLTDPWIRVWSPTRSPQETETNLRGFIKSGIDLLEGYLSRKSELEQRFPGKQAAGITRMLSKHRVELEYDIDSLAKQHNVISGKWMLFPDPRNVDHIWASVARHTLNGTLGSSAKVSTAETDKTRRTHHLICIYTQDYSNLADVKRVLKELRRLHLVDSTSGDPQNRPIYYKCDAYTYLEINNGNDFKIKASRYNSKDLFLQMKKDGTFL